MVQMIGPREFKIILSFSMRVSGTFLPFPISHLCESIQSIIEFFVFRTRLSRDAHDRQQKISKSSNRIFRSGKTI